MPRPLRAVPADADVHAALREALAGGPALLAYPVGTAPVDLPAEVPQRVALVVETSGSSGRPKRVALSADAVLASAAGSESALGGPGQWVLALPVHYIAGLNVLARAIAAGTEPVAVAPGRFTAVAFLDAVARLTQPERHTALVPAQLQTLLADREARAALRDFSAVLVGGQATPEALLAEADEAGIRVVRSYGSSETSGGSVYDGVPLAQVSVRIVDGEVRLAGPVLAEGYLGDAALTADRFVEDDGLRWYRTADGGVWDGDRLVVTGRLDDVLISGGVKVALAAVERVLREQPGFADAVVVAADDAHWGQVPVAFTAASVEAADADLAIAAIAAALGVAARPRIERIDGIPLLPSGKPDRRALTARTKGSRL